MTRVLLSTRPGRSDKPNEDFVAALDSPEVSCAVLLDGAGGPSELPSGCVHGVPWYVRHLGSYLVHAMATAPGKPLAELLGNAIEVIALTHRECDLSHPGTPASTVVMTRRTPEHLEYLVLGDSSFVADVDGKPVAVTDRRIDDVAAAEYQLMSTLPTGTEEHQQARIAFVTLQRLLRNRADGYWIASTDPQAAEHAYTGSHPIGAVRRAALVSDGAERFVSFGLGDWDDLLDLLAGPGPGHLFDTVRAAENSDPDGSRWPRAKRYDDVAAVFMRPGTPRR